jgi:putative ABC transport system permease protein
MKRLLDPLATAWGGVVTHKLRSFLTILGIVIGVAAVIALMSIGRGATASILSDIESIGADLITVSPGFGAPSGGIRGGMAQNLTIDDADAIAESINNVETVAPSYSSSLQVVVGEENTNATIVGTTPEYKQVNQIELASGTFFSSQDYQRSAKVAVIGSEIAETLFENTNPLGQRVRMGTIIVRIIGVMEETEGMMMFNVSNNAIYVPLTSMQQTVSQPRTIQGDRIVSSVVLTVDDEKNATQAVDDISALLRERHHLSADDYDDFRVMSVQEISSTISEVSDTMTLVLGAIAAISLLVGGIGVMNIMLVSVLERTREIGIRKALGAKESDIWVQFLIEAAFLSLSGGIIGVIIGWLIAFFVDNSGLLPTLVSFDVVALAVGVSVAIGLFFGFYPAWNASRLNPIEALRSE